MDTNRPFIDPRTSRVIEHLEVNWQTSVKKNFNIKLFKDFPRASAMSRNQHMKGLRVLGILQKDILTENERIELMEFDCLKAKIEKDRAEFSSFVDQYVAARLRDKFQKPSPEIAEVGRLSIQRDPSKYEDRIYSIQTAIQLEDQSNEFIRETKLVVEEELKAFGSTKTIRFESETPMVAVLTKSEPSAKQFLQKDPEATTNYNAFIGTKGRQSGGIYISTQAIYQILSAQKELGSWTVPFLVQQSDSGELFVFFENPCQKSNCLSQLELEKIGLETCFQAILTKVSYRSYSFDEERFLQRVDVEVKDKKCDSKSDQDDDDDEESRLIIDTVEEEDEEDSQDVDAGKEEEKDTPPPNKVTDEYKLVEFDEYLSKYAKDGHKEPINYIISRVNLKSTLEPEPLPLIITNSCDGLYKNENAILSFKFECKSEFGAQRMSLDELLKEWCSIAFSSRVNLVIRLRIDYLTSIVMSVNYLNKEEIESEMNRLYGLKPERILTRLYNILNLVTRFPAGKYLLDKDQSSAQILVYMETERSDCGKQWKDLMCHAVGVNQSRPSFVEQPMDHQIVTQLHRINCAFPGCIPPLSSAEEMTNRKERIDRFSRAEGGERGSRGRGGRGGRGRGGRGGRGPGRGGSVADRNENKKGTWKGKTRGQERGSLRKRGSSRGGGRGK